MRSAQVWPAVLAGVVLAFTAIAPALAEDPADAEGWAKLTPDELNTRQQAADTALSLLAQKKPGEAGTPIGVGPIPEAEQAAWTEAIQARRDLLASLVQTLGEKLRPPDGIARMKATADEQLAVVERLPAKSVPEEVSRDYVDQQRAELVRLQGAEGSAEKVRDTRKAQLELVQGEVQTLPDRIRELEQSLEASAPAAATSLQQFERSTTALRLHQARTRLEFARLAVRTWPDLLAVRETELKAARKRLQHQQAYHEKVAIAYQTSLEVQLENAKKQLADAKAAGEPDDSPPVLRLQRQVEILTTRLATQEDQAKQGKITAQFRQESKTNQDLKERLDRLRKRFEEAGGVSARTPELLTANLAWVRDTREQLRGQQMPKLAEELRDAVVARVETQDRMVSLTTPGPSPRSEAGRALRESRDELESALQARYDSLYAQGQGLLDIDGVYTKRLAMLDELQAVVLAHMYWVKTNDALWVSLAPRLRDEAIRVVDTWRSEQVRGAIAGAWQRGAWPFFLTAAGFLVLLVLGVVVHHRVSRYHARWKYRGGTFAVIVQRLLATILLSSLAPLSLVLSVLLFGLLGLPPLVAVPVRVLLLGLAVIWFARRFLLAVFREGGVVVAEMKAPPEVAAQLLGASRWITAGLLAVVLPWRVLESIPVTPPLEHAPRVLYTAMLVWFSLVFLSLLRRQKPLVSTVTGSQGFWYGLWGIAGPLIALGAMVIVAMDVLGYRFGAELLTLNVLQTFVAALALAGVYNVLTNVLDQTVRKLRQRRLSEVGWAEAKEQAEAVAGQVSRFVGVAVIVTALYLLARFWGVGSSVKGLLAGIEIAEVDANAGLWLTGWDVVKALAWILGGHFVARNLPGLLEVVLFSRFPKVQAGTRYVIVTVSKYATILVAYSAAILSLHLGFSNLGWALAGVSLGVGFGMQEIVSNFVSGLILFFERPVRVGDVVSVGTITGTVDRISIRATQLVNWDRQVIVIPNRKFIAEEVTNWTHNDLVIRTLIEVGVAYGSDVARVREVLFEIVRKHPKVKRDPQPRVWFWAFGDSALIVRTFVFTEVEYRVETLNDLNLEIARRFAEEGFEIAFPQRDLHLRTVPDPAVLGALGGQEVPPPVAASAEVSPSDPGPPDSGRKDPGPAGPPASPSS